MMTPEMLKSLPTALNKGKGSTVLSEWEKQQKQDKLDMEQITEEGTVVVAVERDSCKSPQLVELLARFSEG